MDTGRDEATNDVGRDRAEETDAEAPCLAFEGDQGRGASNVSNESGLRASPNEVAICIAEGRAGAIHLHAISGVV